MMTAKELEEIYQALYPHVRVSCDEYHAHGPQCWAADTPEHLTIAKLHAEVLRLRGVIIDSARSLQESL